VSRQKSSNPLESPAVVRPTAGPSRRARPDLYTVLLVIALLAVLTGIVFLWLYNRDYDWKFQGGPPVGMVVAGQSAFDVGQPLWIA
jgi:hypothetical protein